MEEITTEETPGDREQVSGWHCWLSWGWQEESFQEAGQGQPWRPWHLRLLPPNWRWGHRDDQRRVPVGQASSEDLLNNSSEVGKSQDHCQHQEDPSGEEAAAGPPVYSRIPGQGPARALLEQWRQANLQVSHIIKNNTNLVSRYLVYCTDLRALTEAKEICEGDEFDYVLGIDDGKKLLYTGHPQTVSDRMTPISDWSMQTSPLLQAFFVKGSIWR